jgi:type II secretory pathway component GspD/PulD (secretin)
MQKIGVGLIAALLLCSCTLDPVRSDLEKGRSLTASGNYADAYETLNQSSEKHPGDVDLRLAVNAARDSYGNQLAQQADAAYARGDTAEATRLYQQLGSLQGFEYRSRQGLDRMAVKPAGAACPPPDPNHLVSVCKPYARASGGNSDEGRTIQSEVTPVAANTAATATAAKTPATPAKPPVSGPVGGRGGKPPVTAAPVVASAAAAAEAPAAPKPAPESAASPVVEANPASPAPAGSAPRPAEDPAPSAAARPAAPAASADPLERRVTLEFRDATIRSLFDVITQASGLNVIFDRDISPDLKTTVYLRNTTIRAALDKIVMTTGLAWRPLDENTLIVYNDESNKQRDYQDLTVRGFQLSNSEAKTVANSLKTVLKFKDMVVDEKLNMIIVRDTPQALALADKLVAMLDVPVPEVMLEVAILEINRDKAQTLGVVWPTTMSLTPLARSRTTGSTTTSSTTTDASTTTTGTLTLRDLWNLTPGSLGMTISDATVSATATNDMSKLLANPRIRVRNREKAKIMIGERVPNVSATTTSTGTVSDSITYVDVGLKLDVEPQIYPGNEIGLKVSLEVSSINSTLTTTSGVTAYRIGTRNASTVLRLKDGENQVLGGLIQDTDKKSASKVPLLGDVPLLGHLFRSDTTEKDKTELVLSITPRLVRGNNLLSPEAGSFKAGTATSVRGRRNDAEGGGGGIVSDGPSDDAPAQSASSRAANMNAQSNGDKTRDRD